MDSQVNIPQPTFGDLLEADPVGRSFWRLWLGQNRWAQLRPHFETMGRAGAAAAALSARAEREGPRLLTHDPTGERIDQVIYHPDHLRLEELSFGQGIVALKYDPAFLAEHRAVRHLTGFGAGYYFAQTESGLYCPICMTDGAAWVLERHAAGDAVAARALAHLTTTDPGRLWQGAMFLTERQGGSDVGANQVQARQAGGNWLLSGRKWFCSNVDADVALTLARLPEAGPGTRGLGLFLVLRQVPAGNLRRLRIERLKDKLGVRSMATGEVTLEDATGYLLGGAGQGFLQMTDMLNMSRLYNAVAAVAIGRRALLEAAAYGSERQAFGRRLWELPLWRAAMADLQAELLGQFCLTFETVRALDRAEPGDAQAAALLRLLTPVVKVTSAKQAVFTAAESMEAIGGNAYIEESPLPRLLRDSQVLPIWEGTSAILSLDAIRVASREEHRRAWFERLDRALDQSDDPLAAEVAARASADRDRLESLAALAVEDRQRLARAWLEQAGRTMAQALLLEAAGSEELAEVCQAAAGRLLARPAACAPPGSGESVRLGEGEEVLLRSVYDGG